MTEDGKVRRPELDPVTLAAHLSGAAIDLLDGRAIEPGELALLLEAAASTLLHQRESLRKTISSAGVERMAEIKAQSRRAYEPWTSEEDASLRRQHLEGRSARELAEIFQRQPGAITSRLRRLGLDLPSSHSR